MIGMLAHVGAGYGHGPWFPLAWLGFWVALVVLASFWWRRRGGRWHGVSSPEAVLGERYARGEVSEDEYRSRLAVLREQNR